MHKYLALINAAATPLFYFSGLIEVTASHVGSELYVLTDILLDVKLQVSSLLTKFSLVSIV